MSIGYAEAMVAVKAWTVPGGRVKRPWRPGSAPKVIKGADLGPWARSLAARYPSNVRVN